MLNRLILVKSKNASSLWKHLAYLLENTYIVWFISLVAHRYFDYRTLHEQWSREPFLYQGYTAHNSYLLALDANLCFAMVPSHIHETSPVTA